MSACTNAAGGAQDSAAPTVSTSTSDPVKMAGISVNEKAKALLPESILASGLLRVASDPTYAPFEYYDTDNKTMIGYDVDFSDAVGAALGLKVEHVPATFDTILAGLASGKYDMAMSSFSITPEREKIVDFVQYMSGGSGMAVAPGNPKAISMDLLTMCGNKIGVQKGSIQSMNHLPKFNDGCTTAGKEPIGVQNFPSQTDANLALGSGRVDAVMADSVSLAYQGDLSKGKFVLAEGPVYQPSPTGLALGQDTGLKEAVQEAVRTVLDSPDYQVMNSKWSIPASVHITSKMLDGQ
ncbi:polar amino acid transport system substrate-binding protein [Paeniglutamicibacter cryotolerans]|uniref:Polar amino acid transport system substrate-binding protein n=2 Tax=Paeniglutamicibacter cryotolerans TaxID=670079 RepID=A0A839QP45_9MICC|nr:polar amino acid transport system substrate-binding protein [Paeniglutamicibacter cryotolerans]